MYVCLVLIYLCHGRRPPINPCVQVLTDMMEPSGAEMLLWLAVRVEGALAMLAYARAELLWWFRHWKEVTHLATWDTYWS